jgi:hypothetical protein
MSYRICDLLGAVQLVQERSHIFPCHVEWSQVRFHKWLQCLEHDTHCRRAFLAALAEITVRFLARTESRSGIELPLKNLFATAEESVLIAQAFAAWICFGAPRRGSRK